LLEHVADQHGQGKFEDNAAFFTDAQVFHGSGMKNGKISKFVVPLHAAGSPLCRFRLCTGEESRDNTGRHSS